MKTPDEIYEVTKGLVDNPEYGSRSWLERHLKSRNYNRVLHVLPGHQWDLYYIALLQLRWGYSGLRDTMEELDSLPSLLDEAFVNLDQPWSPTHCRFDAYLRLAFLLDWPPMERKFHVKWMEMTNTSPNLDCIHQCEVALGTALTEGKKVQMPCSFTSGKKFSHIASTYKNYFYLIEAIVDADKKLAIRQAAEGVKLYKKRARGNAGPGYYGYGPDNPYLFDFQLAALTEFARRTRGWELPTDEAHVAALRNAAAFREENVHRRG